MCTVLLPPGDHPTAANKYIVSYHIVSYQSNNNNNNNNNNVELLSINIHNIACGEMRFLQCDENVRKFKSLSMN